MGFVDYRRFGLGLRGFAVCVAIVAIFAGSSSAALVGPIPPGTNMQGVPDLNLNPANYSYNFATSQLHITTMGFGVSIDGDGPGGVSAVPLTPTTFDIFVNIAHNGDVTGGGLQISGTLGMVGNPTETLSSSQLVAFSYTSATGQYRLIFDNATSTGPFNFGTRIGVILGIGRTNFVPNYMADFSMMSLMSPGKADVFALPPSVPEPTSLAVWALGGLTMIARGSRRKLITREPIVT